jgi:hypothetical protein
MSIQEITIPEIADLLKAARKSGTKATLLIGAGVSKTAGIGLASDFVARIRSEFPAIYHATCVKLGSRREPGYADCMAALTPAAQVKLVRGDIDSAKMNWAHIGIARLEREDFIGSILTPNFDPLASRASALFHRFPAIYDLAGLRDDDSKHIDFDRSYVQGSAIFHLHGQHTGFALLNTQEKLKAQAKRIRPVLDATMKGRPIVIAGYGGENDPLVDEIADLSPFNHGLFWVRHDNNDPAKNVRERLLSTNNCRIVRNKPADSFFTELADALGLDQPSFLREPFQHMIDILKTVERYSSDASSAQDQLLDRAKRQLERAIYAAEERITSQIDRLSSQGRYQDLWDQFSGGAATLPPDGKMKVAAARQKMGYAAIKDYYGKDGPEADAAFAQAEEYFRQSLKLCPDLDGTLTSLASTLIWRAGFATGRRRSALLNEAERRLVSAERRKPGTGAYDLACIYGRRGDAVSAGHWLRIAHREALNFPGCDFIAEDKDFHAIRRSKAFKSALADIGCTAITRHSPGS